MKLQTISQINKYNNGIPWQFIRVTSKNQGKNISASLSFIKIGIILIHWQYLDDIISLETRDSTMKKKDCKLCTPNFLYEFIKDSIKSFSKLYKLAFIYGVYYNIGQEVHAFHEFFHSNPITLLIVAFLCLREPEKSSFWFDLLFIKSMRLRIKYE